MTHRQIILHRHLGRKIGGESKRERERERERESLCVCVIEEEREREIRGIGFIYMNICFHVVTTNDLTYRIKAFA